MIRASWQLLTCSREEVTAEIEVDISNEITLGQLSHNFVMPFMNEKMDARTLFRWDLPNNGDGNLIPIPAQLPGSYSNQANGSKASALEVWKR
jgi:hypothetical protein